MTTNVDWKNIPQVSSGIDFDDQSVLLGIDFAEWAPSCEGSIKIIYPKYIRKKISFA